MKKVINVIIMCAFVLLLSNVALGQKRSAKGATKQTISPPCKGQPITRGFVIVGYRSSAKCGENSELIVKKPADAEIICDTSPVPEGYHVISQQGSAACMTADSNPLTNALSIVRDGTSASIQTPTQTAASTAPAYRSQPMRSAKSTSDESIDPDKKSPSISRPSREEIEIAVRRATVIIGMEMQDVSRAWGNPRTNDKVVEEDGLIHIWGYAMGTVYFRNGIVYKIELLKGH